MSAIQAFNAMMRSFLDELELAFPAEKSIAGVNSAFQIACKTNARLPLNTYMTSVTPHIAKITERDPSFLTEAGFADVPYLKDINIQRHWDTAPDATKEAIWQYLQTLYIIGFGICEMPEDVLRQAETKAQEFADKVRASGCDPREACAALFEDMMNAAPSLAGCESSGLSALTDEPKQKSE